MEQAFQDVFISYGRSDSKVFVTKLFRHLTEQGLRVWLDQNDIPLAVDFQDQIDGGIANSHNFLIVISPHAMNSPYCRKEIDVALRFNKRIIPLLHVEQISRETWQQRNPDGTETGWMRYQDSGLHSSFANMPDAISKINWVYFREGVDEFDESLAGLLEIFDRHRPYVSQHTHLLNRALTWQQHRQSPTDLLIGEERQQAEQWLTTRFKNEPPPCMPTDLHCEYIIESIKNGQNLMTQVFLAYAERDEAIARQISRSLMREGFTVWRSEADIQTGETLEAAIARGLEEADNIVCLMSPESVRSPSWQHRLEYARSLNKRLIPILARDLEPDQIPPVLQTLQYIDLTDNVVETDYQHDENQLIKILRQDAAYYEEHKILLTKALKWERQERNPSILLRGYNLHHAEAWLKVAQSHRQHPPTSLQVELITASLSQPPDVIQDVFISYSRTDSGFARRLNEALQFQGKKTWFDQESIASGADFQQEIYQGIENSDNFLFILSPSSVSSPYCADEVEHAAKLNKRILTILHREVDPQALHPELAKIQWLDFNHYGGDFATNFSHLIRTLDTDRDHVRNHTKWSQRAIEWEQADYSEDLLLRSSELAIATDWLQKAEETAKQPPPSGLHIALIKASEKYHAVMSQLEQTRQQKELALARRLAGGAIAALATVTGLAVLAGMQWVKAEKGQVEALTQASTAQFAVNPDSLDALIKALEAATNLKHLPGGTSDAPLRATVMTTLAQAVNWIPERNRLEGHGDFVQTVRFSPDGQTIATASGDRTVKLWSRTGQVLNTLSGHKEAVRSVSFSPDGQTIATASLDHTVKLWTRSGTILHTLTGHRDGVVCATFSPDGTLIATASWDQTVKLWDRQGNVLKTIKVHKGRVNAVSFSPDGQTIATASDDSTVKLLDRQGKVWRTLTGHSDHVLDVSFSPDGRTVATASQDQSAILWNRATGRRQLLLQDHSGGVQSVRFSHDGKTIATGSYDQTVKLWNLQGEAIRTFRGHRGQVNSISFSPDDQMLASASNDKTVKLWRLVLPWTTVLAGHHSDVYSVNFSPDGKTLATGSGDTTARLWSLSGHLLRTFKGHNQAVYRVSFSPDGKILATGSGDSTAKLWPLQGKGAIVLNGHTDEVISVSFSPNGELIATGGGIADKTARVWNQQGKLLQILRGHQGSVYSASFSPDGQEIATASKDGTVKLWNRQGKAIKTLTSHRGDVYIVRFSPDNQLIATASEDNTIKLWNRHTSQTLSTLTGHTAGIWGLAFAPDSQMLASASDDGTIKLWQRDGTLIMTLLGHQAEVNSLSFSPDGKILASASSDKTVVLWKDVQTLRLETLLQQGCGLISDYIRTNPHAPHNICR